MRGSNTNNNVNNNNNSKSRINKSAMISLPRGHRDMEEVAGAQDTIYLCNFRVSVDGEWLCLKELEDLDIQEENSGHSNDTGTLANFGTANNKFDDKVDRDWVNYCRWLHICSKSCVPFVFCQFPLIICLDFALCKRRLLSTICEEGEWDRANYTAPFAFDNLVLIWIRRFVPTNLFHSFYRYSTNGPNFPFVNIFLLSHSL